MRNYLIKLSDNCYFMTVFLHLEFNENGMPFIKRIKSEYDDNLAKFVVKETKILETKHNGIFKIFLKLTDSNKIFSNMLIETPLFWENKEFQKIGSSENIHNRFSFEPILEGVTEDEVRLFMEVL